MNGRSQIIDMYLFMYLKNEAEIVIHIHLCLTDENFLKVHNDIVLSKNNY